MNETEWEKCILKWMQTVLLFKWKWMEQNMFIPEVNVNSVDTRGFSCYSDLYDLIPVNNHINKLIRSVNALNAWSIDRMFLYICIRHFGKVDVVTEARTRWTGEQRENENSCPRVKEKRERTIFDVIILFLVWYHVVLILIVLNVCLSSALH